MTKQLPLFSSSSPGNGMACMASDCSNSQVRAPEPHALLLLQWKPATARPCSRPTAHVCGRMGAVAATARHQNQMMRQRALHARCRRCQHPRDASARVLCGCSSSSSCCFDVQPCHFLSFFRDVLQPRHFLSF
jgi:hypothetical protein